MIIARLLHHWGIEDPARVADTSEEKGVVFQQVRHQIKTRNQPFATATI
ncbi:hypothetical protein IC620_02705 [Hazenella sp. IB182357]|uniref:Uncharacterized protein n=1 Tax=Polycladospora coralii TaxID=2771432 RepID=A0A926RT55_9BACL|nr:hypothetical protein [Polycladospora coralii]